MKAPTLLTEIFHQFTLWLMPAAASRQETSWCGRAAEGPRGENGSSDSRTKRRPCGGSMDGRLTMFSGKGAYSRDLPIAGIFSKEVYRATFNTLMLHLGVGLGEEITERCCPSLRLRQWLSDGPCGASQGNPWNVSKKRKHQLPTAIHKHQSRAVTLFLQEDFSMPNRWPGPNHLGPEGVGSPHGCQLRVWRERIVR